MCLGRIYLRYVPIILALLNAILKLLRDRNAFAALGLKVANVLDLPKHIFEILWRVGHVIDTLVLLGLSLARLAPEAVGTGNTAKGDVKNKLLRGKVVVDVAFIVLYIERGRAPVGGVRVLRVNVGRRRTGVPGKKLQIVVGPFHGD